MDIGRPPVASDAPRLVWAGSDGAGADAFSALFGGSATGIALCRLDGAFAQVNRALADLLDGTGIDPEAGSLLDLMRFLPDGDGGPQSWGYDLARAAEDPRHVARLHVSLAPVEAPPRFVEVSVTRIALGGQDGLLARLDDAIGRRLDAQRLVYLATHDALTGLANRELVQQRLVAALARSATTGLPVGVLYLDLDRFKHVNDEHGHHAGDAVLAAAGQRLAQVLRAADTAGRLGGDEFLVVAGDVPDHAALAEVRRRLEAALGEPVEVDDVLIGTDASIGAVLSRPGEQPATLIRRADAAMYAAKRARRRLAGRLPASRAEQQLVSEQAAVAEHR